MLIANDVLSTTVSVMIQNADNDEGVVRIPSKFMQALELSPGCQMELAARYQFRFGYWELLLSPILQDR